MDTAEGCRFPKDHLSGSTAAEVPGEHLILGAIIRHPPGRGLSSSISSPMADHNNTLNTANGREFERKDRATSDSDSGNVVDHYAPHGESSSLNGVKNAVGEVGL